MTNEIEPRLCTKFRSVIYSRAVLVGVTSECLLKKVICKTWTGTFAKNADLDQTAQNAMSDQSLYYLLKLQIGKS